VLCSRVRFLQKTQCFGSVANIFYKDWLHCSVMDTAVMCPSVSWSLLWYAHHYIVTAVIGTPLSLTMLWHAHEYHWHHCDMHSGVINTAVLATLSIFSVNSKPYPTMNHGLWGSCLIKRTRVQKSHFDSLWLNLTQCYSIFLTPFYSIWLNLPQFESIWHPPFDKIWLYSTQI
jgi:hypothetical protein